MRNQDSKKVKLELELANIAPFSDSSINMTTNDIIVDSVYPDNSTYEESKTKRYKKSKKKLYLIKIRTR